MRANLLMATAVVSLALASGPGAGLARAQAAIGITGAQISGHGAPTGLSVTGLVGTAASIQSTADLSQTNSWATLTNFTLSASPFEVVDAASSATGNRFYRLWQTATANLIPSNPSPDLLVWIPPGSFIMGSPPAEAGRSADETQHSVTLTAGFYMGKYSVTQDEYAGVAGTNPSYFTGNGNAPVDSVAWSDAAAYCAALTALQQSAGLVPTNWAYRLPTEAEREYACRAGTTTAFYFGPGLLSGMANFNGTEQYVGGVGNVYDAQGVDFALTTTVGSYEPNAFGLYDMHGNLCEWCQDWYGPYPTGSVTDPAGPATGTARVYRGGSWRGYGGNLRAAVRDFSYVPANYNVIGFRVVLSAAGP